MAEIRFVEGGRRQRCLPPELERFRNGRSVQEQPDSETGRKESKTSKALLPTAVRKESFSLPSNKFSRMMENMGFKGGTLGKNGRGLSAPIMVTKLLPKKGLGYTKKREMRYPCKTSSRELEKDSSSTGKARKMRKISGGTRSKVIYQENNEEKVPENGRNSRYDGVILHMSFVADDLMEVNLEAWKEILFKYFCFDSDAKAEAENILSRGIYSQFLTDESELQFLLERLHPTYSRLGSECPTSPETRRELIREKDRIYCKLLERRTSDPSRVRKMVESLKGNGWKVGLIHPGTRRRANADLRALDLKGAVHAIVNASSDPDSLPPYVSYFKELGQRLQIPLRRCLSLATDPYEVIGNQSSGVSTILVTNMIRRRSFLSHENSEGPNTDRLVFVEAPFKRVDISVFEQNFTFFLKNLLMEEWSVKDIEGCKCFGMFSEDGRLYAAEVLSIESQAVEVKYTRYQNKERLPLARVAFALPAL